MLVVSVVLLLAGCNGDGSSDENNDIDTTDITNNSNQSTEILADKAKKIFYLVPSPIETAALLKKAGANYDMDILNPIENVSKYETISSKALNLGIYGADLSYVSIFDQTQETMLYVSCTKRMADDLGITSAFDSEKMERIEENINRKDSMLNIISDSYWIADAYLKENQRANISAIIITGGWVEGLYIATQLADNSASNSGLVTRIAEQKYSLDNLYDLVSSYEKSDNIDMLMEDISTMKAIFDQLEIVSTSGENTTDSETGVTTIGSSKEIKISEDQLAAITSAVESIRNKYIE